VTKSSIVRTDREELTIVVGDIGVEVETEFEFTGGTGNGDIGTNGVAAAWIAFRTDDGVRRVLLDMFRKILKNKNKMLKPQNVAARLSQTIKTFQLAVVSPENVFQPTETKNYNSS